MPFDEQDTHSESSKKQKMKRACDVCRRKKIGCDGPLLPGGRCSNCVASSCDCSYSATAKRRANSKEYVAALESRLNNMETLLRKFCPGLDAQQLANLSLDPSGVDYISRIRDGTETSSLSLSPPIEGDEPLPGDNAGDADDYNNDFIALTDDLARIKLDSDQHRFFGKSSNFMLIKQALDLKKEVTGEGDGNAPLLGYKRREFWTPPPWELSGMKQESPDYVFPDDDLLVSLVDIYFNYINWILPILYRPTFERGIASGLHKKDKMFASTVLAACAIAARYSDDPRVLMDGTTSCLSAGWKWFDQVRVVRRSLLSPPTLYELQFYCLAVTFLHGSTSPQACWTMSGIGIRLAQEIGAHRRRPPGHKHTVEDEMRKRVFWVLVCIDRIVSAAVGRPCAMQEEDFDVEFPIECDEEYWEHPDPEQAFKQPPGKPSIAACCNAVLRLSAIQGRALRELYSVSKPRHKRGNEQTIVAELDSALNEWIDSVPDHLRWDPNRDPSTVFHHQSVALYASYYSVQILIHRPFISTPRNPSPLTFPSLAICTNAARSCCRIIEKHGLSGALPLPQVQLATFSSAVVLLFHIWGGKRAGLSVDGIKGMEDVHKCMAYFKSLETRWHSAGRCWDLLHELTRAGDLPQPQPSPPSHKRERDQSEPIPDNGGTSLSVPIADEPRPMAGSRRVASKVASVSTPPSVQIPVGDIGSLMELPMNSYQLGQFAMYQQNDPQNDKQFNSWDTLSFSAAAGSSSAAPIMHGTDPGMNTNNLNYMDEAIFDQMSFIFSNPFGERSEQQYGVTNNEVLGMLSNASPPPLGAPTMSELWSGYGSTTT